MKKTISFCLICALLILCFSACSSSKENIEQISQTTTVEQTETTTDSGSEKTDKSTSINLNDYVIISFEGKNLAGYGKIEFDKEKFLLDHIGNVAYNEKNLEVYKELYGDKDESAASALIKCFSVSLDKQDKLSNEDVVKTVWEIDKERIETYFNVDYVFSAESYTVAGLQEADTFDPFERLRITFNGIAPYGKATVDNFGTDYGGKYKVTPNENLKNGDKVTVTYSCEDKSVMIAKYGVYPSAFKKTYTVKGLNSYVQSIQELTKEQQNKLISDASDKIWISGYGNYKEAKYCGNFFFTAKDKEAHGVQFLSWCGLPVGNAVCFVFEYPKEIDVVNSPKNYAVITLENLLVDEKGELVYNKHEMSQWYDTYDSQKSLIQSFVGVYDDIMNCSNNVDFD